MWKLVKVFVISEKILTDYWELVMLHIPKDSYC